MKKKKWKKEYHELLKSSKSKDYSKALELKKQNLPKYLYRYRPFSIDKINRTIREIYGFIYLSNIKDFNDPYDTKSILNDGRQLFLEKIKKDYCKSMLKHFSVEELKTIFAKSNWFDEKIVQGLGKEAVIKKDALEVKDSIKGAIYKELVNYTDTFNKMLEEQIRITCFTERWNNLPMWYHYAGQYNGYCIEYNTSQIKDILFVNRLLPVNYVKKYREIIKDFLQSDYKKEASFQIMDEYATTKLRDWNYECEWRLVLNLNMIYESENSIPEIVKKKGPELLFVKPNRIIIGANMAEENIRVIERECQKFNVNMVRTEISSSGLIIK